MIRSLPAWLMPLSIMVAVLLIAHCANRLGQAGITLAGVCAMLFRAMIRPCLPAYRYFRRPRREVLHDTGELIMHLVLGA